MKYEVFNGINIKGRQTFGTSQKGIMFKQTWPGGCANNTHHP